MVLAHRWAHEHRHGAIAAGVKVLHTCDRPPCVADAHLFLGTQSDNVADCAAKGRRNQTRYRKLSEAQRDEIRRIYAGGGVSQSDLAAMFGVSQATISHHTRTSVI